MKRVRFKTSKPTENFIMSDSECHSPRPFIETQMPTSTAEPCFDYARVVPYTVDPVHRYEYSNSNPYPSVNKTRTGFVVQDSSWKPSDDLNLSLLDASGYEPCQPAFSKSTLNSTFKNMCGNGSNDLELKKTRVLSSIENKVLPPNVLVKDNSFFIRRDNVDKYHSNPFYNQFNQLNICKENNPIMRKAEIMKKGIFQELPASSCQDRPQVMKPIIKTKCRVEPPQCMNTVAEDYCQCHHCVKTVKNIPRNLPSVHKEQLNCDLTTFEGAKIQTVQYNPEHFLCYCTQQPKACSHCIESQPIQPVLQNIHQSCTCSCSAPQNAVDKKIWAIEKFEKRKQPKSMEIEKQTNVSKEKREPTVADLFKIIKLQNEQLQLLQDKVDKFISASQQNTPTISCSTEHVTISENDQMKMSIGVMTSFEMVRTSTVINKEIVKQTNENQIQCNRSQISIKEKVSKPANLNFLDGIIPMNNPPDCSSNKVSKQVENGIDKTLNELSLCNIQVENATTPNISPDQTLYLDVRDYSESDASSNDQSNVGWTYYNKVMTHVNGMLQDSEMPSSASAMFRNMRQQCVQMQMDKSNVSVAKRVKFGDDPLGIHQPHLYTSTDTSLKMNQLAAKYLNAPVTAPQRVAPRAPIDMSFATRNYMERHKLLQGQQPLASRSPQTEDIPRFLDITALKQQPKFL